MDDLVVHAYKVAIGSRPAQRDRSIVGRAREPVDLGRVSRRYQSRATSDCPVALDASSASIADPQRRAAPPIAIIRG
jgi:hypothetical protein